MSTSTGRCLCGEITVTVDKETLNKNENICVCHCTNCCRLGGSLGSINLIAPDSAVTVTGEPKVYQDNATDSGKPIQRSFCGNCGSAICSRPGSMPGMCIVKLGLFDEIPKPSMELYCKSRSSWDRSIEGSKQFDAMPTA